MAKLKSLQMIWQNEEPYLSFNIDLSLQELDYIIYSMDLAGETLGPYEDLKEILEKEK